MRTIATIYLCLFSFGILSSQYSIDHVKSASGAACNGFATFRVTGDTKRFELELYHKAPDGPFYSLVQERDNFYGQGYFQDLCQGSYNLKIKDSFGCTKYLSFLVEGCSEIELQHQPEGDLPTSCLNNGWIFFATPNPAQHYFTGLVDPVDFLWSNGQTGPRLEDLASGEYTLTVVDSRGCNEDFTFKWIAEESTQPIIDSWVTPTCEGENIGTIAITSDLPPGTLNQEFRFVRLDNGDVVIGNAMGYENLTPGIYNFTISHLDGSCSNNLSLEVVELSPDEPLQFEITPLTLSCANEDRGTAEINISGGIAPYIIESSIGGASLNEDFSIVSNLSSGEQIITITDFCGAVVSREIEIEQNPSISIGITEKGFQDCNPEKGRITIRANAKFSINYNGNIYSSSSSNSNNYYAITFNNLDNGPHNIVAFDEYGCRYDFYNIFIEPEQNSPFPLKITIRYPNINCEGNNPQIAPIVTGGTPPYTYTWQKGKNHESPFYSAEDILTNPPNGFYRLEVSDACLNRTIEIVDFECECFPQFEFCFINPCDKWPNHSNYEAFPCFIRGSGRFPRDVTFEWLNQFDGDIAHLRGGDWSGKTNQKVHDIDDRNISILVKSGNGCSYEISHFLNPKPDKPVVTTQPVYDTWNPNTWLSNIIGRDLAYDIRVRTNCMTQKECNGQFDGDFKEKRFRYKPDSPGSPCDKGTIICPLNNEELLIEPNSGEYFQFEEGVVLKSGCLWEPGVVDQINAYVFGIISDEEFIDISIGIDIDPTIYFPDSDCVDPEIVSTNANDCTATISCEIPNEPVQYAENVSLVEIRFIALVNDAFPGPHETYCNAPGPGELIIYKTCPLTSESQCEQVISYIHYSDAFPRLPMPMWEAAQGKCNDLLAGAYRDLCNDNDLFPYATTCEEYLWEKYCPVGLWEPPIGINPGGEGGEGESSTTAIQLTPNPTSGAVTIAFEKIRNDDKYQIEIKDIYGRPQWQSNIQNSSNQISVTVNQVSQFQPGVYYVLVIGQTTQTILVASLIVQ